MKALTLLVLGLFIASAAYSHSQQTTTIKLYFPNPKLAESDCPVKVHPVKRTIPKTNAVARAALEQLFAGPNEAEKAKGFVSDFSDETKSVLISVNVKKGAAYVNLKDLTTIPGMGNFTTSCGGSNFFGQVENTLKQFPTIKKVFFAIDGNPSLFYSWMQMDGCPKELKNCDASNFIK